MSQTNCCPQPTEQDAFQWGLAGKGPGEAEEEEPGLAGKVAQLANGQVKTNARQCCTRSPDARGAREPSIKQNRML